MACDSRGERDWRERDEIGRAAEMGKPMGGMTEKGGKPVELTGMRICIERVRVDSDGIIERCPCYRQELHSCYFMLPVCLSIYL